MSTPNFRFKQFTVWHDRCAMKVGTDAVLLGAWTPLPENLYSVSEAVCTLSAQRSNILDIGTGSGVIALMLAQRCPNALIDAIDIDPDAISQAAENFAASPWSNRLHAHCTSLQSFQTSTKKCPYGFSRSFEALPRLELSTINYQLIVSNPPYFVNALKNPDKQRQTARHTDSLSYAELLQGVSRLLADDGIFAVILPAEGEDTFLALAQETGLYPLQKTYVHPTPSKQPKRILMALQKSVTDCSVTHFTIASADSPRSEEYQRLTQDFYL